MSYTVKKLAEFSSVSIRTLHYYDEIGLLKPAFTSESGYRYYQEEQLLVLQQILFFRELGFELKQIKEILGRSDFDKSIALQTHKKILKNKIKRLQELIITIDATIKSSEGKQIVDKDIFKGFDMESEQQNKYEKYLEEYFSNLDAKTKNEFKKHSEQSKENVKDWSKQDWKNTSKEFEEICLEAVKLMQLKLPADSKEVQNVIRKHFNWLGKFWKPNKESYAGHAQLIKDSALKNAYNKYNPELSDFICEGIIVFAKNELN